MVGAEVQGDAPKHHGLQGPRLRVGTSSLLLYSSGRSEAAGHCRPRESGEMDPAPGRKSYKVILQRAWIKAGGGGDGIRFCHLFIYLFV